MSSSSAASVSTRSQSNQEISLSWQYPLLLPCWVRPTSSPIRIMGTPWDSSSVDSRLRCWRARRAVHLRIVRRSLDTAVPGAVVVLAVGVALAVGVVVLVVVGDQVRQREPVVRGDEVDAGHRVARVGLVEVGAAGEPAGEVVDGPGLAPPEVAHRVAVVAVPLRPQRREVAHLVAALADVPRLGDELHLADHRVLLDQVEEGREPIDLVQAAGQRGGEVEAEPVHVHLGDPVAQAVHHQLEHVRVAHVQRVARCPCSRSGTGVGRRRGGSTRRCRCP